MRCEGPELSIFGQPRSGRQSVVFVTSVTEPPRKGFRRQDQLERFSAKREHNQHTSVQYHIIHSSRSYYNLGLCISCINEVEAKITL
jgi:hypothetical protein